MTTVNVTEFRKNLPSYLAKVQQGQTVQLTKRGKVIALLAPPTEAQEDARHKLMALRSKAVIGDVVSPLDESWEALRASS